MSETQRIMAASQQNDTIHDARGRVIEVRRVTRRESMRLMRMWGGPCNVQAWLGNAMLAACARSLDGVPLPPAASAEQAEALVERLDDDGLEAVGAWLERGGVTVNDVKDGAKN